jgi:NAD(P)-dependent dehydrogenase (short-subunit alcohol dehydrogenase family)
MTSASHDFNLTDRVIIVTGAGKGLGRAYALDLARRGAKVVVNNRWTDRAAPSSAEAVVTEIMAGGGQAIADFTSAEDPNAGEALVSHTLETFGRLDAVIANAGVPEAMSFIKHTPDSFRAIFDVNFFGTLHIVQAAWRHLTANDAGRVIVSTSGAGLHANAGMSAYSASKAALIGLMKSLALEGKRYGLCVNAIAPYATTPMTQAYMNDPEIAGAMRPELIAPLVSWLAAPACSLTGQVVVSGGGYVRLARAVEGPIIPLGEDIAAALDMAGRFSEGAQFSDANAAFNAISDAATARPAAS